MARRAGPLTLLGCAATLFSGPALAQERSWPGWAWAQLRFPTSPQPEERSDLILRVSAEQQAQIVDLDGQTRLRGTSQFTLVRDTERLSYNNKATVGAGVELQTTAVPFTLLSLGIREEWERRFVSKISSTDTVIYGRWDFWREMAPARAGQKSPIMSSWGEARYPSAPDAEERDNGLIEGAVELSVPVVWSSRGATLSWLSALEFKADTKTLDYNNQLSPAIGLKLDAPLKRGLWVEVGAKYVADYRFRSDRFHHGPAVWVRTRVRW